MFQPATLLPRKVYSATSEPGEPANMDVLERMRNEFRSTANLFARYSYD